MKMSELDRQAFNALNVKVCPKCGERMLWDDSNKLWYCPDDFTEVEVN